MKLLWALSSACAFPCKYCYFKLQSRETPPSLERQLLELAGRLSDIGVKEVLLTGAEPLQLPFLPAIVREVSRQAIDVTITTNAIPLTSVLLDTLIAEGATGFLVSLDSHDESTYNELRGGGYRQAIQGLRLLVESSQKGYIQAGACAVLTKKNLHELPQTVESARLLGLDYFKFQVVFVPADSTLHSELALEPAHYRWLLTQLDGIYNNAGSMLLPVRSEMEWILSGLAEGRSVVKNCWAGKRLAFLSEQKMLHPCPTLAAFGVGTDLSSSRKMEVPSCPDECPRFSADCACLWEVAYQEFPSLKFRRACNGEGGKERPS